MDPSELHTTDFVQMELQKGKVISPYAFFGVNHSGFLGAMSTIITYVIVLMQFKASE